MVESREPLLSQQASSCFSDMAPEGLTALLDSLQGVHFVYHYIPGQRDRFLSVRGDTAAVLGIPADALIEDVRHLWRKCQRQDLQMLERSIVQTTQSVAAHFSSSTQPHLWKTTWHLKSGRNKGAELLTSAVCTKVQPDHSQIWVGVIQEGSNSHERVKNKQKQTLQGNEQTLQKITDEIAGVILQARYNADGPIEYLYVSQGAQELFGVTRENLMANSQLFWALCHPDDRKRVKASIHHAIITRDDWEESWRINRPDGELRWIRVSSRHYRTLSDGTSIRVSCFVDVSHEMSLQTQLDSKDQKLRYSEQALTDITNLMPGVIMQLKNDPHTQTSTITYISKGVEEVFGLKHGDLLHDRKLYWQICHPDDLEQLQASSSKATKECVDWNHSWRIIRPDTGKIRWIRATSRHFQTLPDGQVVRVGYFFDVTHEKQLENTKQKLEADVQEARQLLVDINNVIPGCVYLVRKKCDGTWDYPFMSAGGEALFERPIKELQKKSHLLIDYSHPDDRDLLVSKLNDSFQYNGLLHVVWRIITPTGKVKWIRGDSRPFRTKDDGTILRAGFFVDVTRERELEVNLKETTDRLSMILQAIPGGLYQSEVAPDGQQTFLFANHNIWTLAGLPADTPLSESYKLMEGVHPDDRQPHKISTENSCHELTPRHYRCRFRRYDTGKTVHIEVHTRPSKIEGSENVLFTGVALDVSRQVELEESLVEQKIKAEEASVAKSTFLANVSHEMRTPLNGILGYGQLLAHELTLTGQAARNLSSLRQCSDHLLAVINEVLDMAKIESGRLSLDLKPMALYRLLDEVSSVITPLADSKGLTFNLNTSDDLPGYIKGDATRLRQILINLLNNAVKFTDEGDVSLKASIKNDIMRFDIQDTGCGIPQSRIDKVFQPFERMDVHHSVEGTGLGLAITRRIVEALEGTVTLESTEGVGSCFTIELPCEEAEAIEESPEDSDFQLKKLNITPVPKLLVVDDRESNRDVLKQWLTLGGFEVAVAINGQEALDHLRNHPCDLVLSDLRMPIMGGLEMMKIIKEDNALKDIPCVAVSASVFPEQVRKILLSGFREFLPKPCTLGKLFTCVYNILNLQPGATQEAPEIQSKEDTAVPFPEQERTTILDMLDMGDIEGLQDHIHQLRNTQGLQATAQKLSQCLDELDMEGFRKVLHES